LLRIIPIGAIFTEQHAIVPRLLVQALGAEDHPEESMPLIIIIVAVEVIGVPILHNRILEL
jgi:hypothetical protein